MGPRTYCQRSAFSARYLVVAKIETGVGEKLILVRAGAAEHFSDMDEAPKAEVEVNLKETIAKTGSRLFALYMTRMMSLSWGLGLK